MKRDQMAASLPQFYETSREFNNLLDSQADGLEIIQKDINSVLDQFFVDSATWGLAQWEKGLSITPSKTATNRERRSVIKSKLRGSGTTTIGLVKNVAEAYTGEVDVEEKYTVYEITIKFVGTLGVPTNLEDCKNALREIIPAHLALSFEFIYTTWDSMDAYSLAFDGLDALSLDWTEFETYEGG
ncbi:putative phage tail protein [Aureibacillus halotolerans]|uniref:Uncharacterized protein YmfQ (DUF2313 family) n=1 Tax=Aureibacillus halotolerans TaxID=1508390 RepID=A0A4R6TRI5_9BACI|nr:putative phage tail protein [Aureibacillus halotolerans]TDQ35292.1 uncharacterized protein YmfQ (DUF2313 family) [Aureibacillus halotolerans]